MSRELPKGWVEVRLEEIASEGPTNGYSPKSGPDAKGTTSLKLSATTGGCFVLNENTVKPLYEEIEPASKYWLKKGDLLIQRANSLEYLGVSAVFPGPDDTYVYPDLMMRVRCGDACETRYLWRHLNCKVSRSYFRDNATGTAGNMPKINGKVVKDTPIRLPPLNEQKRIVAKIDALTEKSREAREALDEVPALLDQLRQSILAAAFRGDLTKKWREQNPDVEPASVLLERMRKERRKKWEEAELAKFQAKGKVPKGDEWKSKYKEPEPVDTEGLPELPEGWYWASVEELASVGTGATPKRGLPKFWEGGDIPWVTSGAVNQEAVNGPTEFTTRAALVETNLTLYPPGTLLVAMYGEGKTRGMCSELGIEATTNQALAALVVHAEPPSLKGTLKRFLHFNYEATRMAASGGVQPNLNLSHIRRIAVPLPPLSEQAPLQVALDSALERVGQLRQIQIDCQERHAQLEPAILAKAFRGELVPQDPNDEPASVLLERIRKEREGAGLSKKSRGKKKS